MTVTLSPETQQLIADRMAEHGYDSADELIRDVFGDGSDEAETGDPGLLDAIAEGEAQADRGEGRPLAEVREEFRRRFGIADL